MPQFDTTFFSSQIFWTIVSFLVLFVVLGRWILPRIAAILQERTHLIEEEIAQARRKQQEVDEIKLDYADKLSSLDDEAKKMFDASEKRIIERREQLMGEWKAEMERKKRDFREETEIARQIAIRDIRNQSADLIVDATEQILHRHIDDRQAQQLLEEAIEEMEKDASKKV
ncbi:MAG: ATP synthase F0 subunit B [Zetaproteobacteria bacterium CG_4_9_14_3_um_filter_53_7]|nr:MAG: ATP synthase F0 subunit B [Zetaproteobacteria bacterium CG_4_9_14_3_um_filter_53_7]